MKKKIYSLFIGRWQPFHKGHQALIRTVLDEGKNVLIAVRNTDIDDENPYLLKHRIKKIEFVYAKHVKSGRVKVIPIPDIEDVCYGREVGWGVREIRLTAKTERISSTKIRSGVDTGNVL